MPRFRQRANFRSGPRRQTEWLSKDFIAGPTSLNFQTFVLDSLMDAVELAKLPFTITRTIGLLSIISDQATASESPHGAYGALVVSEKAATLGPTALPDPVTEGNSDEWFLYGIWDAMTVVAAAPAQVITRQYAFDSRAQRKVEEGEQIVFMIANAALTPANAKYHWQFRILIKLH